MNTIREARIVALVLISIMLILCVELVLTVQREMTKAIPATIDSCALVEDADGHMWCR